MIKLQNIVRKGVDILKRIVLTLAVNTISFWIINYLFSGVRIDSGESLMLLALCLSLFNITIKPLLHILSFPVTILTFGLFSIVINAVVLSLAFSMVPSASIDSFTTTILAALVLSIVNSFLNSLIGRN